MRLESIRRSGQSDIMSGLQSYVVSYDIIMDPKRLSVFIRP